MPASAAPQVYCRRQEAADNLFSSLVQAELSKGRVRDFDGLLFAAAKSPAILQILLSAGANPNSRDRRGWTPLMHAVDSGSPDAVSVLIAAGADVSARILGEGYNRESVLLIAVNRGNTDIIRTLVERVRQLDGPDPESVAAIKRMIQWGTIKEGYREPDSIQTAQINEALVHAAYRGDSDAVQLLLDSGAEPDRAVILTGTALHWAVINQHADVVRILLDAGADPYCINRDRETPLDYARNSGNLEILGLIDRAGGSR